MCSNSGARHPDSDMWRRINVLFKDVGGFRYKHHFRHFRPSGGRSGCLSSWESLSFQIFDAGISWKQSLLKSSLLSRHDLCVLSISSLPAAEGHPAKTDSFVGTGKRDEKNRIGAHKNMMRNEGVKIRESK
jgi:hypothetical protein